MALPFIAQLGLTLLGGAGKTAEGSQQQAAPRQSPVVDITGGMSSLPAKQQPNVYDNPLAAKFGYTPAAVHTQPGAGPNVAQVTDTQQQYQDGRPIPGNPNMIDASKQPNKSMWQQAWEMQQRQARVTEQEYAKQNPLYGMFYGMGMGIEQRMR